jgi:hypothetical protein
MSLLDECIKKEQRIAELTAALATERAARQRAWSIADITDDMVDFVEGEVGSGCRAWDMIDPREIIAAAINAANLPAASGAEGSE